MPAPEFRKERSQTIETPIRDGHGQPAAPASSPDSVEDMARRPRHQGHDNGISTGGSVRDREA
jgi:hypothetical protein